MSADITRPQGDSQLTIPEEAVTLAVQAVDYAATDETTEMISVALEAAAPLIVAAYLEQLAEWHRPATVVEDYDDREEAEREGVRSMCNALRLRAAELRGGAQ